MNDGTVEPTEADDASPLDNDEGDGSLAILVRIANAGAMQVGVTLSVAGATITGTLVGVAEFDEGLADWIERETGGRGDVLTTIYRQRAEQMREDLTGDFEKDFAAPYAVSYIHLKDARIVNPVASMPREGGIWWRGRIDRVDGWFIGNLSV